MSGFVLVMAVKVAVAAVKVAVAAVKAARSKPQGHSVWSEIALTPKALANVSPGLERSDNPGLTILIITVNPERVRVAHA
jgi:hypothetical protein